MVMNTKSHSAFGQRSSLSALEEVTEKTRDQQKLIDELVAAARSGASKSHSGTVSGGIAAEHGDDAHSTLARREGMISASAAPRSDYWIASASANLPALVGMVGAYGLACRRQAPWVLPLCYGVSYRPPLVD